MSKSTHIMIGCSSAKRDGVRTAVGMYTGQLFDLSLRWANLQLAHLWILSAKYGLLERFQRIESYNCTLNGAEEIRAWNERVEIDIRNATRKGDRIIVLAGSNYSGWCDDLAEQGRIIEQPLRGMGIGTRKQWLAKQIEVMSAQRIEPQGKTPPKKVTR